jgi:hypothetical protein
MVRAVVQMTRGVVQMSRAVVQMSRADVSTTRAEVSTSRAVVQMTRVHVLVWHAIAGSFAVYLNHPARRLCLRKRSEARIIGQNE